MKKKKRVSLKDIAKALNVSATTISFVLNGKGKEKKISDEVIKKVEDYVKSINYKPNFVAQSLRTGKTKIIVLMMEDISNIFFANIARIIEDIAYDKDYKVLFCSHENKDDKAREFINIFSGRQVDGFIIAPPAGIKDEIDQLQKNNTPVVLFDRSLEGLSSHCVMINNQKASYEGTKHLIENSFKNIAFITTAVQQAQMLNRLTGYTEAIDEAGLKSYVLQIPFNDVNSEKGRSMIHSFLSLNKEIDAVFFATNYLTQSGILMIKETNPNLINELGVITFDDNDLFQIYTPTISAIAQPLESIGQEVMRIMLMLLENNTPSIEYKNVLIDAELIARESSKPK
ncbi:MAG: LacI family transcriptional regulator [Cytophagaceae bacterium]|nr:LacI family transcriptional regulator [Cytophagaceae bacterium]|tara:strand:- start:16667 stop:17695 length:1029 start_codon:yes stop_codon:yes gene_type:complete